MSEKKSRRARFLAANPLCIFCGGGTPAVEEDHVPSRQLFHRRHWPEGFVFPACQRCNRITSNDEQVVAMLSRILPDPITPEEDQELRDIMHAVGNNRPDVLREMYMTANEKRAALREHGWVKPSSMSTMEIPILNIGDLTHTCVTSFARKLFIALHYRQTEKILTQQGGIAWRWYSNVDAQENKLPEAVFERLGSGGAIERGRKSLSEQFDFVHAVVDGGEMAAYFVFFRKAFAMFGIVCMDEARIQSAAAEDFDPVRVLKPWPPRPA